MQVDWNATSDAEGYRVLRSYGPDGPWVRVADININTGHATVASEVVNLWSALHTYVPGGGALGAPDTSSDFHYVELSGAGERCFKVLAYNGEVRGPVAPIKCSGPI